VVIVIQDGVYVIQIWCLEQSVIQFHCEYKIMYVEKPFGKRCFKKNGGEENIKMGFG